MAKRDYYDVLGLSKSASADEIKRAYRKLALQHHPDKHGGDDKEFKEISEAHEVLKDDKKRAAYDQFGHAAGAAGAGGPFGGGGNPFGGFNAENFDFSQFQGGFGDIFDMFMGGAGQRTQSRQQARGVDMEATITIDFHDAVFGTEEKLKFSAQDRCDRCEGKGAEPGTSLKTCGTCNGQGHVTKVQQTILGSIRQTAVCSTCEGRGEVPEQKCSQCSGKGVIKGERELNVKIPAGIDNGVAIRLAGQGGADRSGPTGDLFVHVRVKPHPSLRRVGQNIESTISVPMIYATLGGEVPVETVDGKVTLKVPTGTQSGRVFKLSGHGVPSIRGKGRGDHLVTVTVETPTKLSARQKELLEQFADESPKKSFWKK